MPILPDYLTRKLVYDNHPSLSERQCLSRIQTKHPCSVCREICPEHVFHGAQPDWDLCSGCGLCVSACPSRALSDSRIKTEQLCSLLSRYSSDIAITCRSDVRADTVIEMPGSLPWELLAFLMLQGNVTILTGDCDICPNTGCRSLMLQNSERVRTFFASTPFEKHLTVTDDANVTMPQKFSRREAISHLMKGTGRSAAMLLPSPEALLKETAPMISDEDHLADPAASRTESDNTKAHGNGMFWADFLFRRIRHRAGSYAFCLQIPSFTEACTACSLCAKICPQNALIRAPGPEGSGRFYMASIPWRCTGCGLCARICPQGALTLPVLEDPEPQKPKLHAVRAVPCRICKEPVPGGSGSPVCERCRGEQRS